MDYIRRILSPVQVAKFFVWVEKHQQSVKALTALWDAPADGDEGGDGAADGEGGKQDDAAPKEAADGDAATDTTAATPPPAAPTATARAATRRRTSPPPTTAATARSAAASDGDGATAGDGTTPPPTAGAADGDSDTPATDGGEAPAPELADSVKQRDAGGAGGRLSAVVHGRTMREREMCEVKVVCVCGTPAHAVCALTDHLTESLLT